MPSTHYDKELRKAKAEIEKTEERRAADAERPRLPRQPRMQREGAARGGAPPQGRGLGAAAECSGGEDARRGAQVCLEELTKLEMALKQGEIDESRRNETQAAAEAELSELDKQVAEIEEQLRALEPSAAAKQADAERRTRDVEHVDAELQKLHSKESRTTQFSSAVARQAPEQGGERAVGVAQEEGDGAHAAEGARCAEGADGRGREARH